MQTEWTQVANLALARISQKALVSINDDNELASRIRTVLVSVAKQVLEAHDWNSATKRVRLSKLSESPVGDWAAQYTLPADFIRATRIFPTSETGTGWTEDPVSFERWKAEQGVLLVGQDSGWTTASGVVGLVYIAYQETNIVFWSELLKDCIACLLAVRLATNVKGSSTLSERLFREYEHLLQRAQLADTHREGNSLHLSNLRDMEAMPTYLRARDTIR